MLPYKPGERLTGSQEVSGTLLFSSTSSKAFRVPEAFLNKEYLTECCYEGVLL